ncbi:hypothetical protein [Microbacterium sp.]|uniref:hypothetical protein n=1 Tax=Microbacterium sp. TaxID=51671 RepID=UPI0039E4A0AE
MTDPITHPNSTRLLRAAIWVAIGALIAAAIVCVVWVLLGDSHGMVGRAFLTILLLASFAGIAILEANLASRRPAWFALASMVTWVLTLLIGAFLIWMPPADLYYGEGMERFAKFLGIVLILQLALLHIRLYIKAHERHRTTFTAIVTYVTIGFVVILAGMLVLPLMLGEFARFLPIYWRVVVALAILAAVGTALVPLVNALLAPRSREPRPHAPAVPQWPTYAGTTTPLPVMPDGTPDWNAYYTGQPTYPHGYAAAPPLPPLPPVPAEQAAAAAAVPVAAPGPPPPSPQVPAEQTSAEPSEAPASDGETRPYPPPLPPR